MRLLFCESVYLLFIAIAQRAAEEFCFECFDRSKNLESELGRNRVAIRTLYYQRKVGLSLR